MMLTWNIFSRVWWGKSVFPILGSGGCRINYTRPVLAIYKVQGQAGLHETLTTTSLKSEIKEKHLIFLI